MEAFFFKKKRSMIVFFSLFLVAKANEEIKKSHCESEDETPQKNLMTKFVQLQLQCGQLIRWYISAYLFRFGI